MIGTQATLFTEFADQPRDVDFPAFPRLAAFAGGVLGRPVDGPPTVR